LNDVILNSKIIELKPEPIRVVQVISPENNVKFELPLFLESVSAGFPSPADDYMEGKLDLNDYLVRNPSATFFVRVTGDSMIGAGIYSGDILIVDRSLAPKDDNIIIAVIDSDLTVKRLGKRNDRFVLMPENPKYEPIEIKPEMNFEVWGVVTSVIHNLR
jgi:DNA polymerase V